MLAIFREKRQSSFHDSRLVSNPLSPQTNLFTRGSWRETENMTDKKQNEETAVAILCPLGRDRTFVKGMKTAKKYGRTNISFLKNLI